jgi:hypothetical protein
MSDKEQFEEIGRVVIEHKDAAQKLSAIESQIKRGSDQLEAAAKSLNILLRRFEGPAIFETRVDDALQSLPSSESLLSLLTDARREAERFQRLEKHKKDFGL